MVSRTKELACDPLLVPALLALAPRRQYVDVEFVDPINKNHLHINERKSATRFRCLTVLNGAGSVGLSCPKGRLFH